jgi:SprT-like family
MSSFPDGLEPLLILEPKTFSNENLQEIAQVTNKLFFYKQLADIPVKWTNSRQKAGSYHAAKIRKQFVSLEIRLSSIIVKPKNITDFLSVLVHEQIHQYQIECSKDEKLGHGSFFKEQMQRINLMQNVFTIGITHTWDTLAHAKWIGSCPSCGHTIKAHRRINRSCTQCDRRYNPKYRLIYCPNPDSLKMLAPDN